MWLAKFPLIPAQAGIQQQQHGPAPRFLGPRLRGDERTVWAANPHHAPHSSKRWSAAARLVDDPAARNKDRRAGIIAHVRAGRDDAVGAAGPVRGAYNPA